MSSGFPTHGEMSQMKRLVQDSIEAGAIGISTGLLFPRSNYAVPQELIELAKIVSKSGGFYFTHMRGDGIEAVEEVVRIAREADISCQIAHLHGFYENALLIEKARANGLDISFDQYPYRAGSAGLKAIIPSWAHVGGKEELIERLKDSEAREKIRDEIETNGILSLQNLG